MTWVKWLKTKKLVASHPTESVSATVQRMVADRVGSALVVEDGRLVGIFSERDLLTRVVGEGKQPDDTAVRDVCTRNPRVVRENAELGECARLVKECGVRHIPVVDSNDRPVGILSVRDFLHYVVDELETLIARAYRERRIEQLTDPYGVVAERGKE